VKIRFLFDCGVTNAPNTKEQLDQEMGLNNSLIVYVSEGTDEIYETEKVKDPIKQAYFGFS
jgi:hypothetical protein